MWAHPLPPVPSHNAVGNRTTPPVGEHWQSPLAYFPVGQRDRIWWSQSGGWHRVELATGRPIRQQVDENGTTRVWNSATDETTWLKQLQRYEGIPRFDLHVHSEFVLGTDRILRLADQDQRVLTRSARVTVWNAQTDSVHLQIESPRGWYFSGPPITDGTRVYVMERSSDPLQAAWRVAAYDLTTGRIGWRRELGRARDSRAKIVWSNDRLTLIEDRLCAMTHAGVIAGLDCETGELDWLLEYPRTPIPPVRSTGILPRHAFRRGSPPLAHGELLIVAPADSNRLLAIDILQGAVVWSTAPQQAEDVVHLLGVVGKNVIASGDRLYWLDLVTGRVRRRFPSGGGGRAGDPLPQPRGIGRGLIAGGVVYWPTDDRIMRFSAEAGEMIADPIDLRRWGLQGGNLRWHRGVLLLATPDRLAAFAAPPLQEAAAERACVP